MTSLKFTPSSANSNSDLYLKSSPKFPLKPKRARRKLELFAWSLLSSLNCVVSKWTRPNGWNEYLPSADSIFGDGFIVIFTLLDESPAAGWMSAIASEIAFADACFCAVIWASWALIFLFCCSTTLLRLST